MTELLNAGRASAGETSRARVGCAVVTGGSRGIGAASARALADAGWPVLITYRSDADGAAAMVDTIEARGGRALCRAADATDQAAVDGAVAEAQASFGPVLVLVNNAGVREDALALELGDEAWDRVLELNLSAAFRTTRLVLGPMLRARFGRVINVASVAGLRASPGQANYSAAKAGLIGFTQTVAAEVARRGVTVNAVAPGLIDTEFTAGVPVELTAQIPARRMGRPDEVAACVRFLASEDAGYVTGTTIRVDGGLAG